MSRRSGQNGYVEVRGKYYVVRFWKDVPGQDKRIHASAKICPISGPGRLTKPERERRAKEIIAESGADSEARFKAVVANEISTTFREQAEWWLHHVQVRKRKPVAPATAEAWQNCLTAWLNPEIGGIPLASVNNLVMRDLVSTMAARGLSPKTIRNYTQVVKMVVASAVNDEGEQIFPRRWNHEFCDIPEVKNQKTPSFTADTMNQIVSKSDGMKRMLYALMGATGLRAGEALGIDVQHISNDFRTIKIRQKVWRGRMQNFLKTDAGVREVDLCSGLSEMLRSFVGDRKSGLLFCTKTGGFLSQTNILRRSLHPILKELGHSKAGLHAFRRFRATWLRKNRTPEDLIRFWLGHADETVTDGYSKLREDVDYRREVAEKVELGFSLPLEMPDLVPIVPSPEAPVLQSGVL